VVQRGAAQACAWRARSADAAYYIIIFFADAMISFFIDHHSPRLRLLYDARRGAARQTPTTTHSLITPAFAPMALRHITLTPPYFSRHFHAALSASMIHC